MFNYLKEFDQRLYERYLTLERNVKAQSDSFFDSYIDMLEHFLRYLCCELSIDAQSHESSGNLLGKGVLKAYMLSIGVEEATYEKLKDYSLKVNKHKHKNQKTVTVEQVIGYITVFYDFSSAYAVTKGISVSPLQNEYFLSLFGVLERENAALRSEIKSVDENVYARLDAIEQGQAQILNELLLAREQTKTKQAPNPQQEQAAALQGIIDFARRSKQYFHFFGDHKWFTSDKRTLFIVLIINTILFLISLFMSWFSIKVFDVGVCIKLLWIVLGYAMLIGLNKSSLKIECESFAKNTYVKTEYDQYGFLQKKNSKKWKFRWIPRLICIGSICNVFIMLVNFDTAPAAIVSIIFEVLFITSMYVSRTLYYDFYDSYMVYCFTGKNSSGDEVTVIYDQLTNKWYLEDDFAAKFNQFYEK